MFKKRAFACLLAAIMCAAMMPISTMAVDNGNDGVTLNKTATDLDANDQTTVTLSIGATQTRVESNVVFVLDKSTSADVRAEAGEMLDELLTQVSEENIVNVAVISFEKTADTICDWTVLSADTVETIQSAIETLRSDSGTNIYLGLRTGKAMLDEKSNGDNHLVLVTDGITYLWGGENNGTTYSIYSESTSKGEESINAGNDMMGKHHSDTSAYFTEFSNIAKWYSDHGAAIKADIDEYQTEYLGGQFLADKFGAETEATYSEFTGKYISGEDLAGHYCANDAAVYMAVTAWKQILDAGYHAYAYADASTGTNAGFVTTYPWASGFVGSLNTLGGNSAVITADGVDGMFDSVKNSILYEIQSGTVTDRIGNSFDLVEDTFKLTLDGAEITADADTSGSYDISFAGGNYGINYNAQAETITWDINVPVEEGTKLELSYRLTVDEDTVPTDGTVINAKTNESAVLDYTSTTGEEEEKNFPDPTIPLGEKESEPSVDKKANGKDSIGNVQTGDIVSFTLTSSLPEKLTSDTQLVFTDTMTGLELVEDSVVVTIDGEEVDSDYYTLTSYSTSFTVTIDVNGLYEDGEITEEQVQSAAPVVVSYDAAVTAGAGNDVSNTAQVNNSVEVTITGEVTPPLTGGTGTTMFTVGGMILLVAAGALYVANRKKETQN